MLDQNTTTVLTTLITVLGTLGGVVLGVILSNRYVVQQEKMKKKAAIIEEVYILLMNINSHITQNIEFNKPSLEGKELQDYLRRVQALTYLYLPSVKEKFDTFMKSLFRFSAKADEEQKSSSPPQVWKNVSEPHKEYKTKLSDVKSALEKLVK
jgi:hypothetical protein